MGVRGGCVREAGLLESSFELVWGPTSRAKWELRGGEKRQRSED